MDSQNTFDANTTIVGRPTYMATFAGTQDPHPIVERLVAVGYPREDISLLLRPEGSDSAVDLLSGENAAGQDADAEKQAARAKAATTLLILHPEEGQLSAVRSAVQELGGQEFEYEPETRFTGEDSEALVAQTTGANVSTTNPANKRGTGAPEPGQTEKGGATDTAGAEGTGTSSTATAGTTTVESVGPSAAAGDAEPPADAPTAQAGASAHPEHSPRPPVKPLPDTSDLKGEITQLKKQIDHVRHELEERD